MFFAGVNADESYKPPKYLGHVLGIEYERGMFIVKLLRPMKIGSYVGEVGWFGINDVGFSVVCPD